MPSNTFINPLFSVTSMILECIKIIKEDKNKHNLVHVLELFRMYDTLSNEMNDFASFVITIHHLFNIKMYFICKFCRPNNCLKLVMIINDKRSIQVFTILHNFTLLIRVQKNIQRKSNLTICT